MAMGTLMLTKRPLTMAVRSTRDNIEAADDVQQDMFRIVS